VHRQGDGYRLDLALPFLTKGEVSAKRLGDELLLQAGTYRRTLVLPRALTDLQIESASMQDGTLSIAFGGK
jgi:arsenite-transporting ATPase